MKEASQPGRSDVARSSEMQEAYASCRDSCPGCPFERSSKALSPSLFWTLAGAALQRRRQGSKTKPAEKPLRGLLGTRYSGLATLLPRLPAHGSLGYRLLRRLRPLPLLIPPIMKRLVRRLFLHSHQLATPTQTYPAQQEERWSKKKGCGDSRPRLSVEQSSTSSVHHPPVILSAVTAE
jgi:hypothetical protein